MNVSYVPSVLLLCILGFCALSHSLPAPSSPLGQEGSQPLSPHLENARLMWNGAKKALRRLGRRTRRDAEPQQPLQQELDIPGQKFILDLYKNLTNSTIERMLTQANTIRSLDYNRGIQSNCGVFNFSLTAMNSTEFVINAELMLYTNKPPFAASTYFVEVTAVPTAMVPTEIPGAGEKLKHVQEVQLTAGGYVVFPVAEMTKTLIALGERYAIFHVKVYKDVPHLNNKNSIGCTTIKFIDRDFTEETKPVYIVYSYNHEMENINYNDIADEVIENILTADNSDDAGEMPAAVNQAGSSRRRKRALSTNCKVNDLYVHKDNIYNKMVGSIAQDFSVAAPATYNAGICGGSCDTRLIPDSSPSNHAPFVFLLIEQKQFRDSHGYSFQRCCAPVKYGPLTVFSISDGSHQINTILNMVVKRCECLDIIV